MPNKGPEIIHRGKYAPAEVADGDSSDKKAEEVSPEVTDDQISAVRRRLLSLREKRIKKGMRKDALKSSHVDDKGDPNVFDLRQLMTEGDGLDQYLNDGLDLFELYESGVYPDENDSLHLAEQALRNGEAEDVLEFGVDDREDEAQDEELALLEAKRERQIFAELLNRGAFAAFLNQEGYSFRGVKGSPDEIDPSNFVVVNGDPGRIAALIQKGLRTERAEERYKKIFAEQQAEEKKAAHFAEANARWEKEQYERNLAAIEMMVAHHFEVRDRIAETLKGRDLNKEWDQCEAELAPGENQLERKIQKETREDLEDYFGPEGEGTFITRMNLGDYKRAKERRAAEKAAKKAAKNGNKQQSATPRTPAKLQVMS